MENKAHALAAGLFVFGVGALLVLLALWMGRDRVATRAVEIATREAVTGLRVQAPVRLRGVDVGKVGAIGFDPAVPGQVLLRLDIRNDVELPADTWATLGYQGVTGLAFVQLDDGGQATARLAFDGPTPPRIALKPSLVDRLFGRGESLLAQASDASARFGELLAPDNQRQIIGAVERIGHSAERIGLAADQVARVAARLDAQLAQQLDPERLNLPQLVTETRATLAAVGRSADEIGRSAAGVRGFFEELAAPGGTIDRLNQTSDSVRDTADNFNFGTLPRANRMTDRIARASGQFGRVAGEFEDNPQSLLFGPRLLQPGPGEPGWAPPAPRPGPSADLPIRP